MIELFLYVFKKQKEYIFTGIIRDVPEKKHLRKDGGMAIRDSLTGVYNRHYFDEVTSKEFERARRYGHCVSMMIVDVDNLKIINDTYGHTQGDIVLQVVAGFINENIRDSDVVIRYGGDEFLVVLPETNSAGLSKVITKIKEGVEVCCDVLEVGLLISLSIGGSTVGPKTMKYVDEVLMDADKRLHKDKGSKRVGSQFKEENSVERYLYSCP